LRFKKWRLVCDDLARSICGCTADHIGLRRDEVMMKAATALFASPDRPTVRIGAAQFILSLEVGQKTAATTAKRGGKGDSGTT
jgi:hypothetical protein